MTVLPIPKEFLNDFIVLIKPNGAGYTETVISNVRVERTESIDGYLTDNPRVCAEITVWVDRQNSTWTDFPVGAKVRYGSEEYEITEQKVYRVDTPHHCKFKAIRTGDDSV